LLVNTASCKCPKHTIHLRIAQLDVTDGRSVENAIQSIMAEANRIGVLVKGTEE